MNDAPPRHPEYQYLDILQELLDHGDERRDRTGVGTLALFGRHMRFDVSDTFPVLTTRKTYWQTAIREMLWMLSRRFSLREMFPRLAFGALRTAPMPYRVLKLAENYF